MIYNIMSRKRKEYVLSERENIRIITNDQQKIATVLLLIGHSGKIILRQSVFVFPVEVKLDGTHCISTNTSIYQL